MAGPKSVLQLAHENLDSIIRFHEAALTEYSQYISPSSRALEEQTVALLKEVQDAR